MTKIKILITSLQKQMVSASARWWWRTTDDDPRALASLAYFGLPLVSLFHVWPNFRILTVRVTTAQWCVTVIFYQNLESRKNNILYETMEW